MHRYEAHCHWTGSTAEGWESYDRTHVGKAPPADATILLTTGEQRGDRRHPNPEQLVVMAASSCQLLWFLHLAAKARIDVIEYADEAFGEMPADRLSRVVLRPRIVIRGEASEERVLKLAQKAHRRCYVANSLSGDVVVEPVVSRYS